MTTQKQHLMPHLLTENLLSRLSRPLLAVFLFVGNLCGDVPSSAISPSPEATVAGFEQRVDSVFRIRRQAAQAGKQEASS